MLASSESLFPIVNFTLAWLPWKIRKHLVGGKGQMFGDLLVHGGRDAFLEYVHTLGYRGKWIRDEPDLDQDFTELVRNLGAIFLEMKKQQAAVIPAYLPAPTWASILDSEWSATRAAIETGDDPRSRNFYAISFAMAEYPASGPIDECSTSLQMNLHGVEFNASRCSFVSLKHGVERSRPVALTT